MMDDKTGDEAAVESCLWCGVRAFRRLRYRWLDADRVVSCCEEHFAAKKDMAIPQLAADVDRQLRSYATKEKPTPPPAPQVQQPALTLEAKILTCHWCGRGAYCFLSLIPPTVVICCCRQHYDDYKFEASATLMRLVGHWTDAELRSKTAAARLGEGAEFMGFDASGEHSGLTCKQAADRLAATAEAQGRKETPADPGALAVLKETNDLLRDLLAGKNSWHEKLLADERVRIAGLEKRLEAMQKREHGLSCGLTEALTTLHEGKMMVEGDFKRLWNLTEADGP